MNEGWNVEHVVITHSQVVSHNQSLRTYMWTLRNDATWSRRTCNWIKRTFKRTLYRLLTKRTNNETTTIGFELYRRMKQSIGYAKSCTVSNDGTCRLCLRVGNRLVPIFAEEETSKQLLSRIRDCCPITVSSHLYTGYPILIYKCNYLRNYFNCQLILREH